MFKKSSDVGVEKGGGEGGENTQRNTNMRDYVRKLEGKQLTDYVDRYTAIKADVNLHKFLEDKEKIKRETRKLRNMHPKELSPRQSLL